MNLDGVFLEHVGAEALGHLIGKHSSDDAIRVHHGELDVHRHLLVQRRLSQGNELPIEGLFQLVVLGVGGIAARKPSGSSGRASNAERSMPLAFHWVRA